MRSERGIELDPGTVSALQVFIEMPSGATSMPIVFGDNLEKATKLIERFSAQMSTWNKFEAWIILLSSGKEVSREHIKNA